MKTRGMDTRGKKPVPEPKQGIVYKWFFQWSNILFFKIFVGFNFHATTLINFHGY